LGAELVRVLRGKYAESIHSGHIVVLDTSGRIAASLGDSNFLTYIRSCAKPFQAIPVVESGAADKFGFSEKEIACFCGSLNGQDYQIDVLRHIMELIDVSDEHFHCGIHRPSHRASAFALFKSGAKPDVLHNNCAGKHLAMLTLCRYFDWPLDTYTEITNPVQQLMLNTVSEMCDIPPNEVKIGIDGCGVPVFAVPLYKLAKGYLKLASAKINNENSRDVSIARIVNAALKHPEMIAGDERICTEIMRAAPGKIFAKTGAEGSYAMAFPEIGLSAAFKISDGALRAISPVVVEIAKQLEIFGQSVPESLQIFFEPKILNHRNEEVGEIRPTFKLNLPENQ